MKINTNRLQTYRNVLHVDIGDMDCNMSDFLQMFKDCAPNDRVMIDIDSYSCNVRVVRVVDETDDEYNSRIAAEKARVAAEKAKQKQNRLDKKQIDVEKLHQMAKQYGFDLVKTKKEK